MAVPTSPNVLSTCRGYRRDSSEPAHATPRPDLDGLPRALEGLGRARAGAVRRGRRRRNLVKLFVPKRCGQEVRWVSPGAGRPAWPVPDRNRVILTPKGPPLGPCRLALRNAARSHG